MECNVAITNYIFDIKIPCYNLNENAEYKVNFIIWF